ncbi:MAG: hypothetical protein CME06_04160 [Gemmatimonadetes bacterium]|nr:hypothetical protein [Gemmatimonadota bacterium]
MSTPPGVTVVVMVSNENEHLGPCLDSARSVGPMWVVHTGADVATAETARRAGARVMSLPFADSALLKNSALDRLPISKGTWVFLLDADERIPRALAVEIRGTVSSTPEGLVAFNVGRINRVGERAVKGGGWWPDRNLRLVRKGRVRFEDRGVHAEAEAEGQVGSLRQPLLHFSRRDIGDHLHHQARYAVLEARDLRDRWGGHPRPLPLRALGRRWRPWLRLAWILCPSRPAAVTLWLFLARRGYRDGALGWILAVLEGAKQAWTEELLAHGAGESR